MRAGPHLPPHPLRQLHWVQTRCSRGLNDCRYQPHTLRRRRVLQPQTAGIHNPPKPHASYQEANNNAATGLQDAPFGVVPGIRASAVYHHSCMHIHSVVGEPSLYLFSGLVSGRVFSEDKCMQHKVCCQCGHHNTSRFSIKGWGCPQTPRLHS